MLDYGNILQAQKIAFELAEEVFYECLYDGSLDGLTEAEQVSGCLEYIDEHYVVLSGWHDMLAAVRVLGVTPAYFRGSVEARLAQLAHAVLVEKSRSKLMSNKTNATNLLFISIVFFRL